MYIKIHNRKLHYKKIGSGKPILLVHGWGGNIYSLHALACLASKNYTAYLIDLPGFGKSDNPPQHWGIEGYAELITMFITHAIKEKPKYIGHSFGGEIGMYIASHYPQIIDLLILCNSSFKRQNKVSKIAKILKLIPKEKNIVFHFVYPYIKRLYYTLIQKQSDLIKYPHLEKNFRKIITQDLSNNIKKIHKNTLILWGEQDAITPVIWAYELHKNISHSQFYVFPDAGHNLPIQYPKDVWGKIEAFLTVKKSINMYNIRSD